MPVTKVKRCLSIDREVSAEIDRLAVATGRNISRVTSRLLADGLAHNGIGLPDMLSVPSDPGVIAMND